jgi:hypothetical protein
VWYELMTPDLASARAFYGSVVGWDANDVGPPGKTYLQLTVDGMAVAGMLALGPELRAAGARPGWVGYLLVADVDAAAGRLRAAGGVVHRAAEDIAGVGRFSVVADPQGAVFVLFRPPRPAPGAVGTIGWHELHTTDWPAALAFYREQYGWGPGDALDMGPMGTYQLFTAGGVAVGGMFNSPAAGERRFWLYYFTVGDIDAAATRVAAGGGVVQHGPQQVPGGGWVLQATDPQGAAFALLGTRA